MVEAVPSAEQLSAELAAAGFVDLYFEKLAEHPCLTADGVECRETRLIGYKPAEKSFAATYQVLYKGPLAAIVDDAGPPLPARSLDER